MKFSVLKPIVIIVTLVILVIFLAPKVFDFVNHAAVIPRFITSLLFNKEIELKTTKEQDQAVNILLLGIAGGKHDGANLTDTIMFVHIDPMTNRAVLISIPRDLWAPVLSSKINTAYEFGEEKKKGGGLTLAKATVADILGQPINYAFRIDFSGFVEIVDQVGGLDIDVERTFDDYNYPVPEKENDLCGKTQEETDLFLATISALPTSSPLRDLFPCRVEHLHFDKGYTHMDGKTALQYVRSRQAIGIEGTDFARGKRQQKVLLALRDEVLSVGVLLNPFKLAQLSQTLGKSIDTDIKTDEYDDFIKLAQKMKGTNVQNAALDLGLLINPPVADYGAWVLAPKTGDFKEIQNYVACKVKQDDCTVSQNPTISN